MKNYLLFILLLPAMLQAQEVVKTFRDNRIINGHSTESVPKGTLKFIISHRFGTLDGGFYELFGLDNANIRLGLDYGVNAWLDVGVGRNSFRKTYDGYVKAVPLRQGINAPVSVGLYLSSAYNTLNFLTGDEALPINRLSYAYRLLASRRFNDRISIQVSPTIIHRNFVPAGDANILLTSGIAGRFQLTRILAISAEYDYVPPQGFEEDIASVFSIGVEIETKGHVFQLNFTNAASMVEPQYFTATTDRWLDGGIHFGFNISRNFKIAAGDY